MRQMSLERLRNKVYRFFLITFKQSVYATILTILFLFFSFVGHIRTVQTGADTYISYYGMPLEWFKLSANVYIAWYTYSKFEILWLGLALDIIVFVLLSLLILRMADKVDERIAPSSKVKQQSSK